MKSLCAFGRRFDVKHFKMDTFTKIFFALALLSALASCGGERKEMLMGSVRLEFTRISWDTVAVALPNSQPCSSMEFTVLSKMGKTLSKSFGQKIVFNDAVLASEEKFICHFCYVQNSIKLCGQKEFMASPKKYEIAPYVEYPFAKNIYLGQFDLRARITRPNFHYPETIEAFEVYTQPVSSKIKLICQGKSIEVVSNARAGYFELGKQVGYVEFKDAMINQISMGKPNVAYEVTAEVNGTEAQPYTYGKVMSRPMLTQAEIDLANASFNGLSITTPERTKEDIIAEKLKPIEFVEPVKDSKSMAGTQRLTPEQLAKPADLSLNKSKHREMADQLAAAVASDFVKKNNGSLSFAKISIWSYSSLDDTYKIEMQVKWTEHRESAPYIATCLAEVTSEGRAKSFKIIKRNDLLKAKEFLSSK